MKRSKILGTGHFVPDRVVTNFDLAKLMDTSDEWIQQRSGIVERRYAEDGIGPADMGAEASKRALEAAGLEAKDIDCIVFGTLSPDLQFPGGGVLVQHKLGISDTYIPCFDLRNQCSGYLYGMQVADAFIKNGTFDKVLVVGAEKHSPALDHTNRGRDVAVLFGDGSGATILGAVEVEDDDPDAPGLLEIETHAQGEYARELMVEAPNTIIKPWVRQELVDNPMAFPSMNGRLVFMHACSRMPEIVVKVLAKRGWTPADVDVFLPHQANLRINQRVAKQLEIPEEKCHNNIMKYGNLSAGSIPTLLDEVVRGGQVKRGDLVCMAGFGSGFTWGSILYRW